MARKTNTQSADQVPLPFDDFYQSGTGVRETRGAAGVTPLKMRKKLLREPASHVDKQAAQKKVVVPEGIYESSGGYAPVADSGTILWEYVEACAAEVLLIWPNGSELEWAEGAWNLLAQAGLTSYSDAVEYHQIMIRFFALCSLYSNFSRIAWDRGGDIPYAEWAAYLELSELRIGQLLGTDNRWEEENTGTSLLERALHFLTITERPWVLKIIRRNAGGTSALFDRLWATRRPPCGIIPSKPVNREAHHAAVRTSSSTSVDDDMDVELFDADFSDEAEGDFVETDFEEDEASAEKQRALEWLHAGCR